MLSLLVRYLIRFYSIIVSPLLHLFFGPGYGCRFIPTCSQYATESFHIHGLIRGAGLTACRISRCNPLSRAGYDPVPHAIAKTHIKPHPDHGR